MADKKPTSLYFENLGGINLKASEYTLGKGQFLDLRNVDFDVPNSLQKRPGQTQVVSVATSGPVIGLFEYKKLTGPSFIIAGTDTALFYLASNAYTLLDTGWTNGQPQDMLTFLNKLWIANGQKYKYWDGTNAINAVGLPCPKAVPGASFPANVVAPIFTEAFPGSLNGISAFLVAGATHSTVAASFSARAVFVAYSYLRSDGYNGPVDFLSTAKNVVTSDPAALGNEFFTTYAKTYGFTVPAGQGITAINLWIAVDSVFPNSTTELIPDYGYVQTGNLAWRIINGLGYRYASVSLKPGADLNRFYLFTSIPTTSLFTAAPTGAGAVFWGTTLTALTFNDFTGLATGAAAFTGTPFCWFDTNTPKYIDVNQNVMFMSGFSNAPSDMWFTDIGQPELIQPNYQFEVRTNDGDRIMGHRAYNNNVIVFKEESFHKVIGSTPEDFQLVELSTEFGLLSNNAVIEFNEKLLFLDRKGIVQYDGAGWRIISDQIDDIFRQMNLSAAKEKAVAVHHNYRNQVWFGIPINGATENNITVVFDYLVNAWTFFDGFNASSFSFIKGSLPKPTAWRGSPSGMVYQFSESFLGDNGQGISCVPYTRFEQFQGQNSTNVWRRLFLDVGANSSGITGVINGAIFTDYDRTTVRATFAMYQDVFQSKAEIGVVGKAVAVQFSHFSASLPFLLNGYTWQKRNLRNV